LDGGLEAHLGQADEQGNAQIVTYRAVRLMPVIVTPVL
jgi:hypothetical protein